ncbi:glycosyl transferase family 2 [Gracilibacillus saliphilus]|uniref:glycosyl transferase family 2 n=1 Tax=Gracilibacillus saliphilus TaxID=543890 RepID=UPI0013D065DF|nr:glycosyl transferase family 2 [Gracilibacillus saliphilus]
MDGFQKRSISFHQLENEVLVQEEPVILDVEKDGIHFEFLLKTNKDNDKAIVLGSGAYDANSELQPPIFQRHKWIGDFDENLIYYNDPTLYHGKINIGWGFGREDVHYLEEISTIIKYLLMNLNIALNKTLLYGSSAGGFMSLMLGGLLKEPTVLVNNPQTIVWNYYERHVNAMFNSTLPDMNREDIIKNYKERLNVINLYKEKEFVPRIIYLQNISSYRDITHHLDPFILGLKDIDAINFNEKIEVILYADKKSGHNPLKKKETLKHIEKALHLL